MPPTKFITRLVNLEPLDYRLVRDFAEEKGLGRKGFSADLRRQAAQLARTSDFASLPPLPHDYLTVQAQPLGLIPLG